MKVGAGDAACGTDLAKPIARVHGLAGYDFDFVQMAVERDQPAAMINEYGLAHLDEVSHPFGLNMAHVPVQKENIGFGTQFQTVHETTQHVDVTRIIRIKKADQLISGQLAQQMLIDVGFFFGF